jgi:hypothetical protein
VVFFYTDFGRLFFCRMVLYFLVFCELCVFWYFGVVSFIFVCGIFVVIVWIFLFFFFFVFCIFCFLFCIFLFFQTFLRPTVDTSAVTLPWWISVHTASHSYSSCTCGALGCLSPLASVCLGCMPFAAPNPMTAGSHAGAV